MTKKTITICGKEVTLAYSFATEIAFYDLAGQDFSQFFKTIAANLAGKEPTAVNVTAAVAAVPPKTRIMAILASIISYYDGQGQEAPLSDNELMREAGPDDIFVALATVMQLHNEWYRIPAGEPADKPEKKGKGRAKN